MLFSLLIEAKLQFGGNSTATNYCVAFFISEWSDNFTRVGSSTILLEHTVFKCINCKCLYCFWALGVFDTSLETHSFRGSWWWNRKKKYLNSKAVMTVLVRWTGVAASWTNWPLFYIQVIKLQKYYGSLEKIRLLNLIQTLGKIHMETSWIVLTWMTPQEYLPSQTWPQRTVGPIQSRSTMCCKQRHIVSKYMVSNVCHGK